MKTLYNTVRIGLAQVNPTVGDFKGNVSLVRRKIAEAKKLGVQILAFPELILCGYPPEDLLLKPRFLADCEAALQNVTLSARGIAVLVGAPEPPSTPGGRPHNTCCVLLRGKVAARYRKIHLPNYGVFDEKRYFEPGKRAIVADFAGIRAGISICEDIWAEDGPIAEQVSRGGAGVILNISASPYHRRKGPEREKLMRRRARENQTYLCYVNLLGGQDELVFDGSSVIAAPDGRTIARGRPFEEDMIVADVKLPVRPREFVRDGSVADSNPSQARLGGSSYEMNDTGTNRPPGRRRLPAKDRRETRDRHTVEVIHLPPLPSPARKPRIKERRVTYPKPDEEIYKALVLGTRDYVDKNGFKGVVLGLSGGIDSALTAVIAFDALGADRVRGITMPSRFTSKATARDARQLAANLGILLYEFPIDPIYRSYLESLESAFSGTGVGVTEENIQARIRGNILMALSNKFGWLVLATGNKSEIAVGYCTLYGDTAGGFAVLKDVPKTLVYSLSRYRNRIAEHGPIPVSTIRRKPTAELKPGQLDQDVLPPYPLLDRIIELYVERDMASDEIVAGGLDPATVMETIRRIDFNEYKRRQGPPGIKITPKAFGRDRRLPITNRYSGTARG